MSELFPLPLTLWEELFVIDDYESYPANFMVRIRCRGTLPPELLSDALLNCLKSHPLFACAIERRGRRYFWVPVDHLPLPIEYHPSTPEPALPRMKRFDVTAERLWRVNCFPWRDEAGDEYMDIVIDIHHTLCDGLGAIQFVSDVAREIHDLHVTADESARKEGEGGADDRPPKKLRQADTDLEALKKRGKFSQTWKEWFLNLRFQYRSVLASFNMIWIKVASLVPLSSVPVDSVDQLLEMPRTRIGYDKIVFSATESSRLRRICRLRNTTVNTRLATELFRAIVDWKQRQGHPPFDALRLMMPFNERRLSDARLPACNRVTVSPFTRRVNEIADEEKLQASIEEGVKLVKKAGLGINFHRALWITKTFFRGLKALAKTDRIGATALFANVGNLQAHLGLPTSKQGTVCGPLTILDVDLVSTIRVGTSFAMVFHEFDGQSRLGFHYDSNLVTAEQAQDFLAFFKQRILDWETGT